MFIQDLRHAQGHIKGFLKGFDEVRVSQVKLPTEEKTQILKFKKCYFSIFVVVVQVSTIP